VYAALSSYFKQDEYEVIVVINNTTDNSARVLRKLRKANQLTNIRIVDIGKAKGKGSALIQGFIRAKGDVVGFIDADGASPGTEIIRLYRKLMLETHIGGVIASRYLPTSRIIGDQSYLRFILSRLFNLVTKNTFHLPFTDTQCGLKLFRRKPLRLSLDYIIAKSWTFDLNLLLVFTYLGESIIEVPTRWYVKNGSKVNVFKSAIPVIKELWQTYRQMVYFAFTLKIRKANEQLPSSN